MNTVKTAVFSRLLPIILCAAALTPFAAVAQNSAAEPPSTQTAPRIDDEAILALDDRLMRLADDYVKSVGSPQRRIDAVVALMFDPDKLGLVYKLDKTSTVRETVAAGGGNCLSLAAVFVALARYAGLDTSFVAVSIPPNWREMEAQDLYVVSKHMSAEVSVKSLLGLSKYAVEFLWARPGSEKNRQAVADKRAFADFYNNLAVEYLQQKRLDDALYYARKAVATDSRYGYAWLNLGVIYRKLGRNQEAEQSYKTSLKLTKNNPSALNNLVFLYRLQGRDRDAAHYLKKVKRYRMKNPYYLHSLAEKAIAEQSYREAISLLKRAINKYDEEDKFYFTLAKAYHLDGKDKLAIDSLDKARQLVTNPDDKARYSRKLDFLRQENVTNG